MQRINTKNYENIISSVLVDDRENDRVDYALSQYQSLNPKKCHLNVGDYIFIGENGVKVCIEYKTGSDWLNSINSENHHLHNQVYDMTRAYDYTFVVVECEDLMRELDDLYYSSGVSMSLPQINGAIAEFNTESTVLFTQTRYSAFDLMMRQSGKIILQKPLRYKYCRKSTNTALNYLSAIKGLNNKAESICRELGLRSLSDLMELDKSRLTEVKGVGDKLADKILGEIHGRI